MKLIDQLNQEVLKNYAVDAFLYAKLPFDDDSEAMFMEGDTDFRLANNRELPAGFVEFGSAPECIEWLSDCENNPIVLMEFIMEEIYGR